MSIKVAYMNRLYAIKWRIVRKMRNCILDLVRELIIKTKKLRLPSQ